MPAPIPPSRSAIPRRPQLSDDVAVHIRNDIMSGKARPGDYIRLDDTAARLGVSVTPVREALLTLRGEGMVELERHKGYVVAPLSRGDINDLFWLQGVIAEEIARRAARKCDLESLTVLHDWIARLRAGVIKGDAEAIENCEFGFHRAVNLLADSRKLSWFLLNAVRYTPAQFYSTDTEWGQAAIASHERLIDALGAHDEQRAAMENRSHFVDGAARLIGHLDSLGVWTDAPEEQNAAS